MTYDKIILGAGLYGLYAAHKCGQKGQRVLVLERDPAPFMRATYINQARVHQGYHYPRSYSTAIKSAKYFDRFCEDRLRPGVRHQRPFLLDHRAGVPKVLRRGSHPVRRSGPEPLLPARPV